MIIIKMPMTIKELKAWRKRTGYSQGKLAKVLGITPLTVSRWERGVTVIPSFLHLALRCLELEGGELKAKGTKKKKEVKR
ncbi:MAG: helix-turn-helix transcriptional regulator [Nitrospirota bacterium]